MGSEGEGVWQPAADPFAAVCGADAVLLLTEWQQFRQLDWSALVAVIRRLRARRGCGCGLWGRGKAEGAGKPEKTRRACAAVQVYCDVVGSGSGSLR